MVIDRAVLQFIFSSIANQSETFLNREFISSYMKSCSFLLILVFDVHMYVCKASKGKVW